MTEFTYKQALEIQNKEIQLKVDVPLLTKSILENISIRERKPIKEIFIIIIKDFYEFHYENDNYDGLYRDICVKHHMDSKGVLK